MEKEMEPKFKVGDKVVTKRGVLSEIISITEDWVQTRSFRTGLTFLWSKRHDRKLRHANIYDEAGERWYRTLRESQLKGKEMELKFKVGDKVVTPNGEWGEVVDFTSSKTAIIVQVRSSRHEQGVFSATTWNQLWAPEKLRHANIYDEAGERWCCELRAKKHSPCGTAGKDGTAAYTQEGCLSNITQFAERMGDIERAVHQHLKKQLDKTRAQPIFRLKRNDGTNGWEGCHFVLVAEDEREMLVREVDINDAKVRDRIVAVQKSIWTRDYSIGDEIINFLAARGGNFINKVVDNG